MTESRSHLAGTTPFQNRIPVRLLAPQHVKGRLGQMARLCHEPLARGMNATHLRIISCPREGGEMTGYNPDQQPKCGLTESAFRDDRLKPFFSNLLTKRFRPCQNQGDWTQQGRLLRLDDNVPFCPR